MPNTNFELQMIIREMMAPEYRDRPSAEKLLKRRQLLSDEQRELIVERNKATAANMALNVQMVSLRVIVSWSINIAHNAENDSILKPQQRLKALSPQKSRKLNRSNTIC